MIRNYNSAILASAFVCLSAGCASQQVKPDEAVRAADAPARALELSPAGESFAGMSIAAPTGAVVKESFGSAEIAAGAGFRLQVDPFKRDVSAWKRELAENDVNVLKDYLVDDENAILYSSEAIPGQLEYHVLFTTENVSCQDVKGPVYTLEQAQSMLEACRSLGDA